VRGALGHDLRLDQVRQCRARGRHGGCGVLRRQALAGHALAVDQYIVGTGQYRHKGFVVEAATVACQMLRDLCGHGHRELAQLACEGNLGNRALQPGRVPWADGVAHLRPTLGIGRALWVIAHRFGQ
jgi:hypothetical protein